MVAGNNGITPDFPVWDLYGDNMARDLVMVRSGFEPVVLEPKCLLGTPARSGFQKEERDDLVRYTEERLAPMMQALIEDLVPIFKVLRLSKTSFPPVKVDLSQIGKDGVF